MKKRSYLLVLLCSSVLFVFIALIFFPYQFQSTPPETIYDRSGKVLVGHKQEQRTSFADIPAPLVDMVVAIEDKRFRSHRGVDIHSLARAFLLYLQGVRPLQGASTLDQQLIKLDNKQFVRGRGAKVQENRGAVRLQYKMTKEEILLRYLNTTLFSHGIIGRKSACLSYRGTSCALLSMEQLLVTLMIAQLGANPYRETDRKSIVTRANMYIRVQPDVFPSDMVVSSALSETLHAFPAPLDPRVQEVVKHTYGSGNSAYDLVLSDRIDRILQTTTVQREQYAISDCCVVILNDVGELVSMNVCRSRDDAVGGKVNSCLVQRQTGSAIKPFLYLFAFKQLGLKSSDHIVDEPVQFDLGEGNLYDPKNFDLDYHGKVTYAYALGNSLNVPAVKILHQVGVAPFLHFLQEQLVRLAPDLPLTKKSSDEVGLSLALGTYEMSPLQFTHLWRLFLPRQVPVGYKQPYRDIVSVLSNPVHKVVSFGQDNFLSPYGWAVKTGTSRKFVDGWICGVSSELKNYKNGLTVCLWLGNQNNASMLGASSEVGSYLWSLLVTAVSG